MSRLTIILCAIVFMAALFGSLSSTSAILAVKDPPPLHYKSRAGLMPPAYGMPNTAYKSLTSHPLQDNSLLTPFIVHPSGSWPESVVGGDFTGEGRIDAALTTSFDWDTENDNRLHLFTQQSGVFTRTQQLATGEQPVAATVGNVNHDGYLDVVIANQDDDTLGLFLHTGSGLTTTLTLPTGARPDAIAVGDFNGDLYDDIAVAHAISQTIGIYKQQANGSFAAPEWLSLSSAGYNDIGVGDLNGDGYDDLVVLRGAGHTTDQAAIFYQQNRTLGAPVFRTVEDGGFLAHGLAVGDVTGDGRDDIAVTAGGNAPQAYLNVFTQQTDGTLPLTPEVYAAHHLPEAVAIGDVNHDGRNDVMTVHAAWMTLSVYTQTITGTLSAYEPYPLPYTDYYRPGGLALGDVTNDGGEDVLIANHSSLPAENGLVVLANTTSAPTSTITNPALPIFVTDTLTFPVEGLASNSAVTVEISTNGGRTWSAQPASPLWSYTWDVPTTDGSHILLARAIDEAGRVQSPPSRSRIIVDRTLPQGNLIIDEGATYTNIPTVTLAVSGSDLNDVDALRLANAGESYSPWSIFVPTQTWTLPASDGVKTVLGQVRDIPGNSSSPFSDTIILDTTSPSCGILINDDDPHTTSSQVNLTLTSMDVNSVEEMRVRNANGDWSTWQAYASSLPWNLTGTDGERTAEAQFRDVAGNVSSICQDTIVLDRTPPLCGITIADGASYTIQPTVTLTINGSDSNGVAQMRFRQDSADWTDWEPYTTTYTWSLAMPDGLQTLSAQVKDTPGNVSDACADSITLDTIPPTGFEIINGGTLYTGIPTVTLTLGASDVNGVSHMRFSNTGATWSAWQAYDVSMPWVLVNGDGLKTVYVQYRDIPGNVGGPFTDTITLDTTPPGGNILINENDTYTNIPTVTLTITAADASSVVDMRFSHDGITWGDWEAYASSHVWTLSPGDGPKTVYVQFRDIVGNVSDPLADTIILDVTSPTGQVSVNGGATYATDPAVTLNVSGTDDNPPLQMRYSNDGNTWSAWEPYAAVKAWNLPTVDGMHTVYMQAQDAPGNVGGPFTDTILLDTTPPSCTLSIDEDASSATTLEVMLNLSCSDVNGMDNIRLSNDGVNWEPWQAYAASLPWTLPAGDGFKTIYMQGRDIPGNMNTPISDTILLDTTLPSGDCTVMSDDGYVNNPAVTLSLWSYDENGVPDMQLRNSSVAWEDWIPYAATQPWVLPSGEGEKHVGCRFRDTPGNVSSVYTASVVLDTTAPTCQIMINDGEEYANDLLVTLVLSSTDQYGVADMRFSNDQTAWSTWEAYASSHSWTLPEGSGNKTVWVQFRDLAGNVAQCQATAKMDVDPPTGTLRLNGGASYTNIPTITVNLTTTDTLSGIDQLCLDTAEPCTDWQPYMDALIWTLAPSEDAPQTVCAWLKDHAGNVSDPLCDEITLDQTPPTGSLTINGGASHTNSPTVTLMLDAADLNDVTQMRFSNDGALWQNWKPYTTSDNWVLAAGDGRKEVYAQYQDPAGNISAIFTDTITLHTTPPNGNFSINDGALYTRVPTVTLTLNAVDVISVTHMRFSHHGTVWSEWESYVTQREWILELGDGIKSAHVQFRDIAQNVSTPFSDTLLLDTTSPTGTLSINGGSPTTEQSCVTLDLTALDDGSGVCDMQLRNAGASWQPWQAYVGTVEWDLESGPGQRAVEARFRDCAGNMSDVTEADITVLYSVYLPLTIRLTP
jgi:hypothetical protein